jgi:hypothetical protein
MRMGDSYNFAFVGHTDHEHPALALAKLATSAAKVTLAFCFEFTSHMPYCERYPRDVVFDALLRQRVGRQGEFIALNLTPTATMFVAISD